MRKYKLEINEEQAQVMRNALEFYGRIHMGQFDVIPDLMPPEYRKNNINAYCDLKDKLRRLEPLFTGLENSNSYHGIMSHEIYNDARIAWDLYQVIRYRLAWDQEPNPQGISRYHVHYDEYMACDPKTPKAHMEELK